MSENNSDVKTENSVEPEATIKETQEETPVKRGRKRGSGLSKQVDVTAIKENVGTEGRRTTRSSTRGSTVATPPPVKKEKKTPAKGRGRGRKKMDVDEEEEEEKNEEKPNEGENGDGHDGNEDEAKDEDAPANKQEDKNEKLKEENNEDVKDEAKPEPVIKKDHVEGNNGDGGADMNNATADEGAAPEEMENDKSTPAETPSSESPKEPVAAQ